MPKLSRVFLALLLSSCARAPLTDPANAFRPAVSLPELRDAYDPGSLREAIRKTLSVFASSRTIPAEFRFAGRAVARDDYRLALEALLPELESWERFHAFVRANFEFYEVYGDESWGQVFSTGYYEPRLEGSRRATTRFSEPLYRTPGDLVSIDLKAYAERLPDVKPLQSLVLESKSKAPTWKGRLVVGHGVPKVVPYYERAELQRRRPLAGQGLELAWVDPVDAFFLEIQGSGVVDLGAGHSLRVGYDAQNGAPYTPIGRFLLDRIPKEQMSMQRIRAELARLSREQQQDLFDKNPSFVFFKVLPGESLTYSGAAITAMRTVATDSVLFPKGTLAFFEIELPAFADAAAVDPAAWESKPRWVLDQDTGGAIQGGGRVDLFTGSGEEAGRVAGVMKRKGKLWVVAPKAELLERLRAGAP